jgi:hypothetical protein
LRYEFKRFGCRFIAKPATRWDEPFDGSFQAKHSVDGVYSIHANEVRAPRIAMHDIPNGWSRKVNKVDNFDFWPSGRPLCLRDEGFKILKLEGGEDSEDT